MKRLAIALVFVPALSGCTSLSPEGARVRVYQANVAAVDAPAPALPAGCRALSGWGPITEQTQERLTEDPYRVQRNETAAKGGNVLLVKSFKFMSKPRTDCSMGDTSQDCASTAQNWYKTSFEAYACDASGLAVLAEVRADADPTLIGVLWSGRKPRVESAAVAAPAAAASSAAAASAPARPAPAGANAASLKTRVLSLMQEGVGTDVLAAYARSNRLAAPLTAEEIIDWKKAGISDEVIRATFPE